MLIKRISLNSPHSTVGLHWGVMKKNLVLLFFLVLARSSVAYALSSTRDIDITGDGRKAHFVYQLTPAKEGYQAKLRVDAPDGKELWAHQWEMKEEDLRQMMEEEGRKSVDEWVNNFFDNKPFETQLFTRKKLKETDLIADFIDYSAKELKVTPSELRQAVLQEKNNFIFTYRSAWREELNVLVFVPKYKRFVAYTGYGY